MAASRKPTCEICGRVLRDPQSINQGIGPECATKRAAFYGGGGFSVEQIEALAASPEPDVLRWLQSLRCALRNGDVYFAQRFFANAQRAAGQPTALPTRSGGQ